MLEREVDLVSSGAETKAGAVPTSDIEHEPGLAFGAQGSQRAVGVNMI